ncbi:MAG: aldehyde dehydrogenase family protein, partial [Pseudomonas sp.]
MMKLPGVYIAGVWQHGPQALTVINPSNEQQLAEVAGGDGAAVERATQAARAAFAGWSSSTGAERATVLRTIAEGVEARRERLVFLQASNNGKPLAEAQMDVDDVIATFGYYAE